MAKSTKSTKPATVAKSATKTEKVTEPVETGTDIVVSLPPSAMQVKEGKELLGIFAADYANSDQIKELTGQREYYKTEARAKMTLAMSRLIAIKEANFDGSAAFAGEKKWRAEIAKAYVSLGVRNPDGTLTAEAAKVFPIVGASKEEQDSRDGKRRAAIRNNFASFVKAATRAAEGARLNNLRLEYSPEAHTLKVSSDKALPVEFAGKGKPTSVELNNEKRDGASERASFEALSRIAERKHDPDGYAKKQGNQRGGTTNVDAIAHNAATSEKDLGALCNALTIAITALNMSVTATQRKHLQGLWDVLDPFLADAQDAS